MSLHKSQTKSVMMADRSDSISLEELKGKNAEFSAYLENLLELSDSRVKITDSDPRETSNNDVEIVKIKGSGFSIDRDDTEDLSDEVFISRSEIKHIRNIHALATFAQEEILEKKQEIEKLIQDNAALTSEISARDSALQMAIAELEAHRPDRQSDLSAQNDLHHKKILEQEQQLVSLHTENQNLRASMAEGQSEINSIYAELEALKQQNTFLRDQLNGQAANFKTRQSEPNDLLDTKKREILELENELSSLSKQLESARQQKDTEYRELQMAAAKARDQLENKQSELEVVNRQNSALNVQLLEQEDHFNTKLTELTEQLQSRDAELYGLKQELNSTATKLSEYKHHKDNTDHEIRSALSISEEQIVALQAELDSVRLRNGSLQEQLSEQETSFNNQQAELADLLEDRDLKLKDLIRQQDAASKNAEKAVQQGEFEIKNLQISLSKAEKLVETKQGDVEQLENKINSLQNLLSEKETVVNATRKEMGEMRTAKERELERIQQEHAIASKQVAKELSLQNDENQKLRVTMAKAEKQLETQKTEAEAQKTLCNSLKQQLVEQRTSLESKQIGLLKGLEAKDHEIKQLQHKQTTLSKNFDEKMRRIDAENQELRISNANADEQLKTKQIELDEVRKRTGSLKEQLSEHKYLLVAAEEEIVKAKRSIETDTADHGAEVEKEVRSAERRTMEILEHKHTETISKLKKEFASKLDSQKQNIKELKALLNEAEQTKERAMQMLDETMKRLSSLDNI